MVLESNESNNTGSDAVVITSPTAVLISFFEAAWAGGNQAQVSWETLDETNMWGFNIYRSQQENTGFTQVNGSLILAQNPGSLSGSRYQLNDPTARPGTTYYYRLEVVQPNGANFLAGQTTLAGNTIYLPGVRR